MSDDIVKRLRQIPSAWPMVREAADEIERLRRNIGCARNQRSTQFCAEAVDAQQGFETLQAQLGKNAIALAATLRELRKVEVERDEARRSCCEYAAIVDGADTTEGIESGRFYEIAMNYMKDRGWDCFKDKACGLCDQPSDAVNGHGDCMNCAKDQYGA